MDQKKKFTFNSTKTNIDEYQDKLKTMLEISKVIGADKQKIYRCVKKHDIPFQMKDDIMYFDEATQTRIKSIINEENTVSKNTMKTPNEALTVDVKAHHEALQKQMEIVIKMLENQLEEKDKQIARLIKIIENNKEEAAIKY